MIRCFAATQEYKEWSSLKTEPSCSDTTKLIHMYARGLLPDCPGMFMEGMPIPLSVFCAEIVPEYSAGYLMGHNSFRVQYIL